LVAALNQFSLPTPGKPKSGLADLALSFDIKDGIANAQNLTLNSAFGSGTGAGRVDIAAWAIDVAGTMTVEPNLLTSLLSKGRVGQQQVPFSLKGALDKPGVNLGVRKAGATPAPMGKIDPLQGIWKQVSPGAAPQQPATPTARPATATAAATRPHPTPAAVAKRRAAHRWAASADTRTNDQAVDEGSLRDFSTNTRSADDRLVVRAWSISVASLLMDTPRSWAMATSASQKASSSVTEVWWPSSKTECLRMR